MPLHKVEHEETSAWTHQSPPIAEKKKLQARARAEIRSVSNYVAKLVLEDLRRR